MSTEEYTFLKNSNKYYGVPPSQLRSKGESTKIEVAFIGTPYKTVTKQKCINFKNDREQRGAQITVC